MLCSFNGFFVEPVNATGVGMDVHQTGADKLTLGIDDLSAFRDGGVTHLTEACDFAVFHKKNGIGDQMVTHDKCCIFDSSHKIT